MEMMNDIKSESDDYSNFGGRRKACKGAGLTGKEKRACAKALKASGWKKGMPIPADMDGVSHEDIAVAEKEEAKEAAPAPKSNTMMYAIIGIVLVLIVVGVIIMMKRKKAA